MYLPEKMKKPGHIDGDGRVNIGNASILGLKEDLNIEHGTKFNTALTIFFVPYVLFEIPANLLLKKLKPHVWCMFSCSGVRRS